jgi:subtilase family serine protease
MSKPKSATNPALVATIVFVISTLGFAPESSLYAQTSAVRPLITQAIVESNLVRLSGNVRPEANGTNDRGLVPNNFSMEHMFLQLRRPAAQEQALGQLIDHLHDPNSPDYHKWLTPDQFGVQFGPSGSDIQKITQWLRSHGLSVNTVYPSGMTIDFSGNASQVFAAFHTEIHFLETRGRTHYANMNDPQIPSALAPAIAGIVSLNDFAPRPNLVPRPRAEFTVGGGNYAVTPPDLATIYNFNPVFNAGNTGQNQTIYLIEDTDLYSTGDWTTFRSTFGLSGYAGASLSTVHPAPPSGPDNCSDPGVNSDDDEAILDAEYASAAAPSAAIVIAACANTSTFGGLIAIQNLVNGPSPPAIISLSYGECEASNTAVGNAAFNTIYQQGVAEGISIFVSSGDQDAGGCDFSGNSVTHGIGVNAFASTPYNVAVGGTDFSDTYSRTNGTYWNPSNTPTDGSAKSYIPEIPWNNSCAGQLLANFEGYAVTYGSSGFCNSSLGANFLTNAGGSGGPSGCATGAPSIAGTVSGSCQGYAKPSWQSGLFGNPNDGVRDLPDVSLFAANGLWGHYYIFCYSDPQNGGTPCTGSPSGWSGAGGTSFAAPIMAGVQALVNQYVGAPQGNPNFRLYQLAAGEYGAGGSSACNSSNGNAVGGSCIFYDVTLGDMDANCTGTHNCYRPSGTNGVLSTSNSSYAPAFGTRTGWDFSSGIGSINVYNLVMNWSNTGPPQALVVAPATSVAASGLQGGPFSPSSFNYQLSSTTGSLNYSITGIPSWLNASFTSGTATTNPVSVTFSLINVGIIPPGVYTSTISFTNTSTGNGNTSRTATLTVNGSLTATPTSGPAPLTVELTTSLMPGDNNAYSVDFGDGTSGPMTVFGRTIACVAPAPCSAGIGSVSHIYTSPGNFTATLLNSALTGVATAGITVSGSAATPTLILRRRTARARAPG